MRRPTSPNSCGFGASNPVPCWWLRSAAQAPTERLVCGCLGGSFTLCARTSLELSGCSRALCFGRPWHSPMGRLVPRGRALPPRGRAIGDAMHPFSVPPRSRRPSAGGVSYEKKRESIGVFCAFRRALCVCAFPAVT